MLWRSMRTGSLLMRKRPATNSERITMTTLKSRMKIFLEWIRVECRPRLSLWEFFLKVYIRSSWQRRKTGQDADEA